jgi:diguanylate cyclase (GGDEF)-like protein
MKSILFAVEPWQSTEPARNRSRSIPQIIVGYLLPDSFSNWGCMMLLCLAACWGGVMLGQTPAAADILWPANGVVLAAILMLPRRYWTSYLLGSFGANVLIHAFFPFPMEKSLIFSAANVVEISFAATCLSYRRRRDLDFTQIPSLGRFFLFGVILAPLASTVFAEFVQTLLGTPATLVAVANWYIGDALGIAIMTPLILAVDRNEAAKLLSPATRTETLGLLGGLTLLSVAVFSQSSQPVVFLLFPALLLIIFRLGITGSALGVFLMVVPAACYTVHLRGPFAPAMTGSLLHSIWLLQCFLGVALVTIYSVCVALASRDRLQHELAEAYREANVHAGTDHVTGLPNRRSLDRKLAREWRRAVRDRVGISLMMIDVDQFKLYNDHYGHLAGDACLAAIGEVLRNAPLRESDMAARYGGEEFVVILPRATTEGTYTLAERIREAVAEKMMPHVLHQPGIVTVSVGVATMRPTEEFGESTLIEQADKALYQAKRGGRNQVLVWGSAANE